ncbi:hypothetical protein DTL42_11165 [Bremerella cremea]|uniref:Uncharacterized protein n=1 Tax=Bremerella cremea TaxID=1031537 RepID=A0A368KSD6_9BACT|nr:hypothetical protein [Bremerella cremea]RCS50652.1 hypothetical protein DTL42_11165 [Bremerella cremea]
MKHSIAWKISSFFASHQESGEFVRYPREALYKLIGATTEPSRFVYVTKCSALSPRLLPDLPTDVTLLSRDGLPAPSDVELISCISKQVPIGFLGDLDPADLLTFAWLQAHFAPRQVPLLGIQDRLIQCLSDEEQRKCSLPFDESEIDALPLLQEALPDLQELIGPQSYRLIMSRQKIELEGLVHGHRWTPEHFWQTLFAEQHYGGPLYS